MKTKPTKIDRSGAKWLPGAMALAATTASTQAAIVQITLSGNKISSTSAGGDTLNADLTGDGFDDMVLGPATVNTNKAGADILGNGYRAAAGREYMGPGYGFVYQVGALIGAGGVGTGGAQGNVAVSTSYLNRITFSDLRINGGDFTEGWLQVNAFNSSETSHTVELSRLIFDDASTTRPGFTIIPGVLPLWQVAAVPEPSGFLATSLLLGAAGLIRRRQARAA